MELIYLDSDLREQGIIRNAEFDSEVGGFYDFSLTVPKSDYSRIAGGFVYPRGAIEFGGKITDCVVNSDQGFVTFNGKTWLGVVGLGELPTYSYTTNTQHRLDKYVLDIISQASIDLQNWLTPSTDYKLSQAAQLMTSDDGVINMLDVLVNLYAQAGKVITYSPYYSADGRMFINIGARDPVTYNSFDYANNVIPVEVEKRLQPVTRIIYALENEGAAPSTKTAHLKKDGTWIETNSPAINDIYIGFYTRTVTVYAETPEDFANPNWAAIVDEVQIKDSAYVSVSSALAVDVGDIVTGKDETTGVSATQTVKSKSLHLSGGIPILSFETE